MPRCCMKIRKNDFFDFPNLNLVGLTPWSVWVAVATSKTKYEYLSPYFTNTVLDFSTLSPATGQLQEESCPPFSSSNSIVDVGDVCYISNTLALERSNLTYVPIFYQQLQLLT